MKLNRTFSCLLWILKKNHTCAHIDNLGNWLTGNLKFKNGPKQKNRCVMSDMFPEKIIVNCFGKFVWPTWSTFSESSNNLSADKDSKIPSILEPRELLFFFDHNNYKNLRVCNANSTSSNWNIVNIYILYKFKRLNAFYSYFYYEIAIYNYRTLHRR